ncbi:MAG: hypothetical protein ACI4YB_01930 [Oscillospiraceae bacterium]
MKMRKITDAANALQKLSSMDLPLKTAYKLSKLKSSIDKELAFFEEKRAAIIEKHIDKDSRTFTHENEQKAVAEISELLEFESDVNIEPVEIPETEDIRLSANDLNALADFVTFKE